MKKYFSSKQAFRRMLISAGLAGMITLSGCGGDSAQANKNTADSAATENTQAAAPGETGQNGAEASNEVVEFTMYRAWNGSSSTAPDPEKDIVAKTLLEKLNVKINWEYVQGSEVEAMNLMFASGDMPEFLDFPYWGGKAGEAVVFKKAVQDGFIQPIDDYIDKYSPFLKENMYKGCSDSYIQYEFNDPLYEGKHFIIPRETVADVERDTVNFLYGLYIRKDIAEAIQFDPVEGFHNTDEIYAVLTKIKNGGFTDINGNPVAPASAGAQGWMNGLFRSQWGLGGTSSEFLKVGDTFEYGPLMTENENASALFMRKLIAEGLYKKENFTQQEVDYQADVANGSVAVFANSRALVENASRTLYQTHPEMEYVPVTPPANLRGDRLTNSNYSTYGRTGSPVFAITTKATEEQIEGFFRVIDYMNTNDGRALMDYGIENETYEMVEGLPQFIGQYEEAFTGDQTPLYRMGIRSSYGIFTIADTNPFRQPYTALAEVLQEKYKEVRPLVLIKGIPVSKFGSDYPELDTVNTMLGDYTRVMDQAFFAKSDEEAIQMLDEFRQKMTPVFTPYVEYVNQKAAEATAQGIEVVD